MSDTETYMGKITPIASGETISEVMRRILSDDGKVYPQDEDELCEYFINEYYDEYFLNDQVLFKSELINCDYEDVIHGVKSSDGSYDIAVQYYNGGVSLSEAVEAAIGDANSKGVEL